MIVPIEAGHLLDWARANLSEAAKNEVSSRACVSRAYYGSFHLVSWLNDHLGPSPEERGGIHAELCGKLQEGSRPHWLSDKNLKLKSLGYKLQAQRDRRVMADYKLHKDFSLEDAEEAISESDKIAELLAEIAPDEVSNRTG